MTDPTYSPAAPGLSSGAHPRELDDFSDFDREDLACLGLRRAFDPDPFPELRGGNLLEAVRAADCFKPRAAAPAKPPRQRKPSLKRMIAAAYRGGKNVTSITTPDGVTLRFGESEPTKASNPWLDDLKVTKQ